MSVCVAGKELRGHERDLALAIEGLLPSPPTTSTLPAGAAMGGVGTMATTLGSFERHDSSLDYCLKVESYTGCTLTLSPHTDCAPPQQSLQYSRDRW